MLTRNNVRLTLEEARAAVPAENVMVAQFGMDALARVSQ
jgi:uncharacterized protein HemX